MSYYDKNKEKCKKYQLEYHSKNKEKIKQYTKEYYALNEDKFKEYNKNYYANMAKLRNDQKISFQEKLDI